MINAIELDAVSETAVQDSAEDGRSQIRMPLNLENWKDLDPQIVQELLWFHQLIITEKMTWPDASEAIGYARENVYHCLNGTYKGSWANISQAIRSYRKIIEQRGQIQQNKFVENTIYRQISAALTYALANNSITLIDGESRFGKSVAAEFWRSQNNHGRSVLVTCPAFGGTKALLRELASALGIGRDMPSLKMHTAILKAFNQNRILIMDEAHRLLPQSRMGNPTNLEILRDIHDRTGAALALIATHRFNDQLKQMEYQFEQLLGRIGMPVRLPKAIRWEAVAPIVQQYIPRPSEAMAAECVKMANQMGRLGILVETLKIASRMASKDKKAITETHFFKAMRLRQEMIDGPAKEGK